MLNWFSFYFFLQWIWIFPQLIFEPDVLKMQLQLVTLASIARQTAHTFHVEKPLHTDKKKTEFITAIEAHSNRFLCSRRVGSNRLTVDSSYRYYTDPWSALSHWECIFLFRYFHWTIWIRWRKNLGISIRRMKILKIEVSHYENEIKITFFFSKRKRIVETERRTLTGWSTFQAINHYMKWSRNCQTTNYNSIVVFFMANAFFIWR